MTQADKRLNADIGKPRLPEERVEAAPDACVAPVLRLQLDEAPDDPVGVRALRVGERRSVVPFDDGDRAAGPESAAEVVEGGDRVGQVFEDEADEDVVEGFGGKRQGPDLGPDETGPFPPVLASPLPGTQDGLPLRCRPRGSAW